MVVLEGGWVWVGLWKTCYSFWNLVGLWRELMDDGNGSDNMKVKRQCSVSFIWFFCLSLFGGLLR